MKVTFVIDFLATAHAGTENQLLKLIEGLSSAHDVELICLRSTGWLQTNASKLPVRVTVFDLASLLHWKLPLNLLRLTRHFRRTRPDVVHTFFPVSNIFAVICARMAGVPAIVASRRDYGHWMNAHYLAATRAANRFVTRIVANADQVRDLTARVEGFPAERIEVIYNGIDPSRFEAEEPDEALRTALGIRPGPKIITLVGNIRPIKRHDTLIDAARQLIDEGRDLELLFVGGNNGNRDEVVQHVAAAGLTERVHFVRSEGDIERYLSISDIGVNCSESEGLSNAIMEYMAAGVPAVVSRGGGNVDLVKNEVHGLTFPVGDVPALASAIARMLDDAAFREGCVSRARQRIHTEMALPVALQRSVDLYRQLVQAPAQSPEAMPQEPIQARVRRAVGNVVYHAASAGPILRPLQRRIAARGVTVFMYHELGGDREDVEAWQVVRRSDFLRQIDHVRRHYRIVSLDEAMDTHAYRGGSEKPVAVITFDDGHRGTLDHLVPIIESEALPATLYVATGHIVDERPYWFDRVVNALQIRQPLVVDLSRWGLPVYAFDGTRGARNWSQIEAVLATVKQLPAADCEAVADHIEACTKALDRSRPALTPLHAADVTAMARQPLLTLGSHSHGHEVLTNIPLEMATASVQRSQRLLQSWTGRKIDHFAYPGGFTNPALQVMTQQLGFRSAMGTRIGVWTDHSPLFDIPRVAVGRYDSLDKFKTVSILGLRQLPANLINGQA